MSCTALILAGGRSTRMGRDKAFLELDGETLLARQVRRVREAGVSEVLVSGRADVDYAAVDARVVLDEVDDQGPVAGIAAGLAVAQGRWVLVLAVDMPDVPAAWLARGHALADRGLVARVGDGLEPLAAWYPRTAHAVAMAQLAAGRRAARAFASACVSCGLVDVVDLAADEEPAFLSWNTPGGRPGTR